MPSGVLQLPLKLGRLVRHRSDPTKAVGIILGWLFDPPLGALVRWQYGASIYEAPDKLKDLADIPGMPADVPLVERLRASTAPAYLWSMGDDGITCVLCRQPVEARQTVMFRRDGQVEHVKCPPLARGPHAPLVPEPMPDPICRWCAEPIRPADSVAKDGTDMVHIRCLSRRPLAGGLPLAPWREWPLPVGDHVGQHWASTPARHRQLMIACIETRLKSRQVVVRAREVRAAHVSVG